MKAILKTFQSKLDLDYDETFNSAKNMKVRHKLVKELRKSLLPRYSPSITQLTIWLSSLHKSRRSQLKLRNSGKIDEDKR
jgi:hypothetical protein